MFNVVNIGSTFTKYVTYSESGQVISEVLRCPSTQVDLDRLQLADLPTVLVSARPDLSLHSRRPGRSEPISFDNAFTGLRDCYPGLGVDRVAALLGALSLSGSREVGVIDLGTLTTFTLSRDWHIRGGFIAPGIGSQLSTPHQLNPALPLVCEGDLLGLLGRGEAPRDTKESLIEGIEYSVRGIYKHIKEQFPAADIFITGGWCESLPVSWWGDASVSPDLPLGGAAAFYLRKIKP